MSAGRHFRGMELLDGQSPDSQWRAQVSQDEVYWVKNAGEIPWNASGFGGFGQYEFKGTLSGSQWTWMRVWVMCFGVQCWALAHIQ